MSLSYIRNKLPAHNALHHSMFMNKQFIHLHVWMHVKNLDTLICFNSPDFFFLKKIVLVLVNLIVNVEQKNYSIK